MQTKIFKSRKFKL